jgi:hypothetical protein
MKHINLAIGVSLALLVFIFVGLAYTVKHSPRIQVTNGQIAFHQVIGARQLDAQTFVVPCQIGDFFRIVADNKTIITTFAPTSDGWAIIHFEYLK